MKPEDSYRLFRTLRDEYELVKPDISEVNQYILPGRNLEATWLEDTTSVNLKLAATDVNNDTASDALRVFVALICGTLVPANMPWFASEFSAKETRLDKESTNWLEELVKETLAQFNESNFYTAIEEFFEELGAYCTAAFYQEATETDPTKAFTFSKVPMGTYLFRKDFNDNLSDFFKVIFKTPVQIVEEYGEKAAGERIAEAAEDPASKVANTTIALIQHTFYDEGKKPVVSLLYDPNPDTTTSDGPHVIAEDRYYEFPYFVLVFEPSAGTVWGTGPGIKALQFVKRIQEMERAVMITVHRKADPPYTVPTELYGRVNNLPGGETARSSLMPGADKISMLYDELLDETSTLNIIQSLENRIGLKFFNDLLLTERRSPNASPLRNGEIEMIESDKWLKLGPMTTRAYSQLLAPLVIRAFNIILRRFETGFPLVEQPPDTITGDNAAYQISLISPLAKAQNLIAVQPIMRTITLMKEMAPLSPEVVDNLDADETIRSAGLMIGAPIKMWRAVEQVQQIRKDRAEMAQAQAQEEKALRAAEVQNQTRDSASKAAIAAAKVGGEVRGQQ